MDCFIVGTSSFLPGPALGNEEIQRYLGVIDGEDDVRARVLRMNGIERRHYAQTENQEPTFDVYGLAASAATRCLQDESERVTFLSAGTTYAPMSGPGIASILHARLQAEGLVNHPVEISSHGGICSSATAAMVAGIRAVQAGQHMSALCVGAEHASEVLKSNVIRPVDDRSQHENVRSSQWFMSVFLRFMLSDGSGAVLLRNEPSPNGVSLKVNWTQSASFAHAAPLCMKLESRTSLLSQDLSVLSRHLFPCAKEFVAQAMGAEGDSVDSHDVILPHMSSFFFRRQMEKVIASNCRDPESPTPYWTNLATVGNTGSASIFLMLDHYLREHDVRDGQKLLLFVPESGQFNFVLVSLTVCHA